MPSDSVENLVHNLSVAGDIDSQGVFTISLRQARETLAQFALPEPRHYVLNLVASATAAGATRVEFSQTSGELTFSHDGRAFTFDELRQLWSELFSPRQREVEELAIALNSARTLKGARVEAWSWDSEESLCLRLENDHHEVERSPLPNPEALSQGFWLKVTEPALLGRAVRWAHGSVELGLLEDRAVLAPLTLSLQGKEVSGPLKLGLASTPLAWQHLEHPGFQPSIEAPDAHAFPLCVQSRRRSPGNYAAVLCLGTPEQCQRAGLRLVLNGVTFVSPSSVLGYPILCGTVWLTHLRKNVSHTELVLDEHHECLRRELKELGESLIVDRLRDWRPLPAACLPAMKACLPDLIASLKAQGKSEQAQPVERCLLEMKLLENPSERSVWNDLLGAFAELEPGCEEALGLYTRLDRLLRSTGKERLLSGRTSEAALLWERLVALHRLRDTDQLDTEKQSLVLLRSLAGLREAKELAPASEDLIAYCRAIGLHRRVINLSGHDVGHAQACLALGEFDKAEELLRQLLRIERTAEAAEALSDLLAYTGDQSASRYQEALSWKELAVALRAREWPEAESFFLGDLLRLAAKHGSFRSRFRYKMRLRVSLPANVEQLVDELEQGHQMNLQGQPGTLTIKSALLAAEAIWAPCHGVLKAARAKAAHLLRSVQLWQEADDILAREALFLAMQRRLDGSA